MNVPRSGRARPKLSSEETRSQAECIRNPPAARPGRTPVGIVAVGLGDRELRRSRPRGRNRLQTMRRVSSSMFSTLTVEPADRPWPSPALPDEATSSAPGLDRGSRPRRASASQVLQRDGDIAVRRGTSEGTAVGREPGRGGRRDGRASRRESRSSRSVGGRLARDGGHKGGSAREHDRHDRQSHSPPTNAQRGCGMGSGTSTVFL
jgi:hypothetical protein